MVNKIRIEEKKSVKILVVYHSIYGHVQALAKAVSEGVQETPGVELVLRRVHEFPEYVQHMEQEKGFSYQVYMRQQSIPECTVGDLREADGVLFGSPTRFGNMTAQMKALIDSTVQLWLNGQMEGKPAGVFTSTASTHGGQETTLLTMMVPLLHLGMVIVGVPYSTPGMIHTEARGGTPYGASTIAGATGELQPTPGDLVIAKVQGKRVAEAALALRSKR
jgi:NAD(P)H dehydrogenase (quinone)